MPDHMLDVTLSNWKQRCKEEQEKKIPLGQKMNQKSDASQRNKMTSVEEHFIKIFEKNK